ncbi:MAG: nucleotidyltransferase family protein [Erysipelotrichaceae bacterium]|nr:nucleotidyltransferase family protein [Erysipelotrichaceae bacterium]
MILIYLAAGNSRRFFTQKLFYEYHGKPLYRYGLDTLLQVMKMRKDCTLRILYHDKQIADNHPDLPCIYSPDSPRGLSYTIKKAIEKTDDDVLFMVADQPHITAETISSFINAFYTSGKDVASVIYGQQTGNPCIFKKSVVPELNTLQNDEGGRKIIKKHDCYYYPIANPKELEDIDTAKDLKEEP